MAHQHDIDSTMESSDVVTGNAGRTEFYTLLSFFIFLSIAAPVTVWKFSLGV